jgi:ubiquinone/menaquinone biosynthesis C-methylase UbiE
MAKPQSVRSKEFFPGVFSRHALAYQRRLDQIMSRGEARGRMRAIELLEVRPGMRVLDMACGPGTLSRRLAKLASPGGEVVGIDLAEGMIELARAAGIPNARFEVMDIEELGFADGWFDAVVCGHGLQFVPDLGRALREARRVLRGGGRFAASVPASAVKESVWKLIDAVIDRHLPPPPVAVDRERTGVTITDPLALEQAALDAGFGSARVEVIDETVHWESPQQLVAMFTGWWDCAARLEGIVPADRHAFMEDALATISRDHPGVIVTTGRNHVLIATT